MSFVAFYDKKFLKLFRKGSMQTHGPVNGTNYVLSEDGFSSYSRVLNLLETIVLQTHYKERLCGRLVDYPRSLPCQERNYELTNFSFHSALLLSEPSSVHNFFPISLCDDIIKCAILLWLMPMK